MSGDDRLPWGHDFVLMELISQCSSNTSKFRLKCALIHKVNRSFDSRDKSVFLFSEQSVRCLSCEAATLPLRAHVHQRPDCPSQEESPIFSLSTERLRPRKVAFVLRRERATGCRLVPLIRDVLVIQFREHFDGWVSYSSILGLERSGAFWKVSPFQSFKKSQLAVKKSDKMGSKSSTQDGRPNPDQTRAAW
jgi:hypothetical protein